MTTIMALSYGFARLTEARTGAARRYLGQALPEFSLATAT